MSYYNYVFSAHFSYLITVRQIPGLFLLWLFVPGQRRRNITFSFYQAVYFMIDSPLSFPLCTFLQRQMVRMVLLFLPIPVTDLSIHLPISQLPPQAAQDISAQQSTETLIFCGPTPLSLTVCLGAVGGKQRYPGESDLRGWNSKSPNPASTRQQPDPLSPPAAREESTWIVMAIIIEDFTHRLHKCRYFIGISWIIQGNSSLSCRSEGSSEKPRQSGVSWLRGCSHSESL